MKLTYNTIVKTCFTFAATLIVSGPVFLLACEGRMDSVNSRKAQTRVIIVESGSR